MSCYSPLRVWRDVRPDNFGVRSIHFNPPRRGADVEDFSLPCGQCIGCRLERSRQFAMRCMHEASLYDRNCFVTLTYTDEFLPDNGSLRRRDLQLFLKLLRKHVVRIQGRSFRFYGCGEYGDLNNRPHYHFCMFDFDFSDKKPWRKTGSGHVLFRSESLERIWKMGNCEIGSVTFESAAYVARYCLKKINGEKANEHYSRLDSDGRIVRIEPEFSAMSNRPGVGQPWLDRFACDVYPSDFVIVNGRKVKPPRFYDKKIALMQGDALDLDERLPQSGDEDAAMKFERSRARLVVKEEVAASRLATFSKRSL